MKSKEAVISDMLDAFDNLVKQHGYSTSIYCYSTNIYGYADGQDTLAYKNSDKWIPTLRLHVWGNTHLSIHVKNRCGNSFLNEGATIAVYKYDGTDIPTFEKMVQYAVNKWSQYGKTNPYIFTSGEDEEERLKF